MLMPIADRVFVHRSELLQNNTVVVLGQEGALLIDPGITGTEMTCLAGDLTALGQRVISGFATHPDWDHVLWHSDLGDAPRYATAKCADFLRGLRSTAGWEAEAVAGLPPEVADQIPLDRYGLVTGLPPGVTEVPWPGPRVRVVEHPAHAQGHAALMVEDSGVLAAGDMLSDIFVPILDQARAGCDSIEDYLDGLGVIEELVGRVRVVVPGHGSIGTLAEARSRIRLDRDYLGALRAGADPQDPRVTDPQPGWEWVSDLHHGQARRIAELR